MRSTTMNAVYLIWSMDIEARQRSQVSLGILNVPQSFHEDIKGRSLPVFGPIGLCGIERNGITMSYVC